MNAPFAPDARAADTVTRVDLHNAEEARRITAFVEEQGGIY